MPRKKPAPHRTPKICPVCGEDVPGGALACPECGADDRSGWRDEAETYDGVGLPEEEEFDYEEFAKQEFGGSPKPPGIKTIWWIAAIALIIAFVAIYFYGAR